MQTRLLRRCAEMHVPRSFTQAGKILSLVENEAVFTPNRLIPIHVLCLASIPPTPIHQQPGPPPPPKMPPETYTPDTGAGWDFGLELGKNMPEATRPGKTRQESPRPSIRSIPTYPSESALNGIPQRSSELENGNNWSS